MDPMPDLVDSWLVQRQALGRVTSANSVRSYRADLKAWAKASGDDTADHPPLFWLTADNIEMTLVSWVGYSAPTRSRRVTTLRSWCKWLVGQGHLQTNPVTEHMSVRVNKDDVDVVRFNDDEIAALRIATTNPTGRRRKSDSSLEGLLLDLLLDSLGRTSELAGLNVADFNRSAGSLSLFGKGSKYRTVPLPDETADRLRNWLTERHPNPKDRNAPLLCRSDGRRLTYGTIAAIVKGWYTDAGVARQGALGHAFRHTGALRYLKAGLTLPELRDMLGHSSLATTSRYLRLSADDLAASVRSVQAPTTRREEADVDSFDEHLARIAADEQLIAHRSVLVQHAQTIDELPDELAEAIRSLATHD